MLEQTIRAVPGCVGAALLFRAIIDQVLVYMYIYISREVVILKLDYD